MFTDEGTGAARCVFGEKLDGEAIYEEFYRLIPRGAGIAPRPRRASTVSVNDH